MKALARWLYMATHVDELVAVKNYAKERAKMKLLVPEVGLVECGKAQGALDTLETLDLLA